MNTTTSDTPDVNIFPTETNTTETNTVEQVPVPVENGNIPGSWMVIGGILILVVIVAIVAMVSSNRRGY